MAKLRGRRVVQSPGVEFQPDLQKPTRRPVRLGAVLVEEGDGSTGVIVIGRVPIFDSRPKEFDGVRQITKKLAANWADDMGKDILEAKEANIFNRLIGRWRWTLYRVEPKLVTPASRRGSLDVIARRIYQKFVGQPFEKRAVISAPKAHVPIHEMPSASQLGEVSQRAVASIGV